jgi:hypothetical protein
MADYFIDTTLASGSNNGTSTDNAWQNIETALEYNHFHAGDYIWVRRVSSFAGATSNITINSGSDGTRLNWINFSCWPRIELTFTATFTNGSTTVSAVSGITADFEQHAGRRIKNNTNGKWYIITNISGSDFIIDREYAGTTAATADCTIEEDELYDIAQAIDDSAWTIKKTTWNADANDLPIVDMEATAYYLLFNDPYHWRVMGIHFVGGTATGTVYVGSSSHVQFKYCLFEQDQNNNCLYCASESTINFVDQCIVYGNSTGTSQFGVVLARGTRLIMTNSAIYNMGGGGLDSANGCAELNNVNIGVEAANDSYDVFLGIHDVQWKDVKLGSTNKIQDGIFYRGQIMIENYQKVLGAHYCFNTNGIMQGVAVVAGSGDPYKRTDGADMVLSITQTQSTDSRSTIFDGAMLSAFKALVWADTTSKTYRFYCQANALSTTAAEVFVKASYVDEYDDTSEYHYGIIKSDETISARSGADDWSQYVEVTVQPAVAGFVELEILTGFYDADGILYIDPMVVIS